MPLYSLCMENRKETTATLISNHQGTLIIMKNNQNDDRTITFNK